MQTRLYCYIKSRWWHSERDNREHLPMWSSSCQHPQPQSLGHDKENHLKNWKALLYPLLKRRTGPHEEEIWSTKCVEKHPKNGYSYAVSNEPIGVSAKIDDLLFCGELLSQICGVNTWIIRVLHDCLRCCESRQLNACMREVPHADKHTAVSDGTDLRARIWTTRVIQHWNLCQLASNPWTMHQLCED